jgi:hypothetical protein
MNAIEAIRTVLTSTQELTTMYLSDLSDADLLVRPVPGANHIAWQLGHTIVSERYMLAENLPGVAFPAFPAGFAEAHAQERAGKDDGFFPKAVYLEQLAAIRGAAIAALNKLSEADLDRPTAGSMARFAPKVGALLVLVGNHTMMHSGQFSVARRRLGKPVLF